MNTRVLVLLWRALLLAVISSAALSAQTGVTLSGRLINVLSGDPIPNATVQIDELGRRVLSNVDGTFVFERVGAGAYHVSVRSDGYSTRRTEVTVSATTPASVDIAVDPELHFEEVTTVSGEERSQFDQFQPTAVLAGQELSKQLEMSIGATLENQPGVAARSFGPAPSRPVVRGLDGDRVLILQDGQRMGDLSSQSGDHGVSVNPASAQRIEVVRGPATLLYGANAIGGLVNVITDDIPTRPVQGVTGNLLLSAGTAASEAVGAADVHVGNGTVALHAGGGSSRSGDVSTPAGDLINSQSRGGFGSVGVAWTGTNRYVGASYGYDDTRYGIPVVEDGQVQLTPRKHAIAVRAGAQSLPGVFDSYRATLAVRRYKHEELEGQEVGTAFRNDTAEVELLGSHRALGRLKGSLGGWFLSRAFDAVGEEALSPAVDQRGAAVFLYEELTWPHATVQFGGRIDHTRYAPAGEASRDFTSGSGSVGVLLRPAVADDRLTMAISLARAARNPALEELYYFGSHPGNFAFEIGNPNIETEHGLGFDASLRWRAPRASGEFTYFRNDIGNYIFRSPVTAREFRARTGEFAARYPRRGIAAATIAGNEFQILESLNADSVLQGFEGHTDVRLTSALVAEVGLDYVHGALKDTHDPLPRIPPLRGQFGLRYQYNAFQAGGTVTAAATQDRIFDEEMPTDGYTLLKVFAAYSVQQGRLLHTITARADNLANELYRNHLSLIKELAPEMGRNLKAIYGVRF